MQCHVINACVISGLCCKQRTEFALEFLWVQSVLLHHSLRRLLRLSSTTSAGAIARGSYPSNHRLAAVQKALAEEALEKLLAVESVVVGGHHGDEDVDTLLHDLSDLLQHTHTWRERNSNVVHMHINILSITAKKMNCSYMYIVMCMSLQWVNL